jgi:hypothetical protein
MQIVQKKAKQKNQKIAKNLTKNVFYTQKQGVSLDTTVSILVDESGSMDDKISNCRSLAIAISEVLERLKIKFEILGHTTGYARCRLKENEQKMFIDSLRLGEEAFKVLKDYTSKINCTHIFVASFHNGSNSLTGAPYFKFDIIKEAFHPTDVQPNDHPFEDVYRNNLLSLYDKLPLALINEEILYFNLEDPKSKALMEKLDRIIISRMQGFNIKQIALHVTYDGDLVSGFVGCVKYDNEKLNLDQLKLCVKELEKIYSKNKNII